MTRSRCFQHVALSNAARPPAVQSMKEKVTLPVGSTGLSPYHLTWLFVHPFRKMVQNLNKIKYLFSLVLIDSSWLNHVCLRDPKTPRPSLRQLKLRSWQGFPTPSRCRIWWLVGHIGKDHTIPIADFLRSCLTHVSTAHQALPTLSNSSMAAEV